MSVSIFDHVPIDGGHHEFALDGTEQQPSGSINLGNAGYLIMQANVDYAAKQGAFVTGQTGFSRTANTDYMVSRSEWPNLRIKASEAGKLIIQGYKS